MIKCYIAPLQGFTDAAFRYFHSKVYGATDGYFTPFIRVERDTIRSKDIREASSEMNDGLNVIPQIIFRDMQEFNKLIETLTALGHKKIDLNLGCPFVPQVRKGRGAGALSNILLLSEVARRIESLPDTSFSIKMRLGVNSPDEWRKLIPIINNTPFGHITVHPRTAGEQYSGQLHMDEFADMLDQCQIPVIYNGEINAPSDISRLYEKFPSLSGVMAGRGLLRRPSLFAEWREGKEWNEETRWKHILELHADLFAYASFHLSGDSQILSHMLPFWEYFGYNLSRKQLKSIIKSGSIRKYQDAVAALS